MSGAGAPTPAAEPQGGLISLISKAEIRYEGYLSKITPEDNTIELRNVKMFGTEGRAEGSQIPPSDQIYAYIIFRGCDIKDLTVFEEPDVQSDPAVMAAGAVVDTRSGSARPAPPSQPAPAPTPVSAPPSQQRQQAQPQNAGWGNNNLPSPPRQQQQQQQHPPKQQQQQQSPPPQQHQQPQQHQPQHQPQQQPQQQHSQQQSGGSGSQGGRGSGGDSSWRSPKDVNQQPQQFHNASAGRNNGTEGWRGGRGGRGGREGGGRGEGAGGRGEGAGGRGEGAGGRGEGAGRGGDGQVAGRGGGQGFNGNRDGFHNYRGGRGGSYGRGAPPGPQGQRPYYGYGRRSGMASHTGAFHTPSDDTISKTKQDFEEFDFQQLPELDRTQLSTEMKGQSVAEPVQKKYDSKNFFDSLSCEALEKTENATKPPTREERDAQHKIDVDTFGEREVSSYNREQRRGGFRGRGRGGGGGGRRGRW